MNCCRSGVVAPSNHPGALREERGPPGFLFGCKRIPGENGTRFAEAMNETGLSRVSPSPPWIVSGMRKSMLSLQ